MRSFKTPHNPSVSKDVAEFRRLSNKVIDGGDPQPLLRFAEKAFGSPGERPYFWVTMERFLRHKGRVDEADWIINEIVSEASKAKWRMVEMLHRREGREGTADMLRKKLKEEGIDLDEKSEAEPNLYHAGRRLAYAKLWSDAEECALLMEELGAEEAAKAVCKILECHEVGRMHEEIGRYEDAIRMYFKAHDCGGLLRCYKKKGDYGGLLMIALAMATDEDRAYIGENLLKEGHIKDGITCLKSSARAGGTGSLDVALGYANRLLHEESPDHLKIAEIYVLMEKRSLAMDYAAKLRRRKSPDYETIAKMYMLMGEMGKAAALAEECVEKGRLYHAVAIRRELGDHEGAIDAIKVMMEKGEHQAAANLFESMEAWELAAGARIELGDSFRAAENFEKAGMLEAAAHNYRTAGDNKDAERVEKAARGAWEKD